MNDPGVWQNQAYQTDTEEVAWQLVDDPGFTLRKSRQSGKIGLANSPQGRVIKSRNALRKWNPLTTAS